MYLLWYYYNAINYYIILLSFNLTISSSNGTYSYYIILHYVQIYIYCIFVYLYNNIMSWLLIIKSIWYDTSRHLEIELNRDQTLKFTQNLKIVCRVMRCSFKTQTGISNTIIISCKTPLFTPYRIHTHHMLKIVVAWSLA